jgi:hypothetical protein
MDRLSNGVNKLIDGSDATSLSSLLNRPKEKSWSVRVVDGVFSEALGYVRGIQCGDCLSRPKLIEVNPSNSRLALFGCENGKCQHRLIKFET